MIDDSICEATGETCPVSTLIDELNRLNKEIEKMKCCGNCALYGEFNDKCDECFGCSNWEQKELRTE